MLSDLPEFILRIHAINHMPGLWHNRSFPSVFKNLHLKPHMEACTKCPLDTQLPSSFSYQWVTKFTTFQPHRLSKNRLRSGFQSPKISCEDCPWLHQFQKAIFILPNSTWHAWPFSPIWNIFSRWPPRPPLSYGSPVVLAAPSVSSSVSSSSSWCLNIIWVLDSEWQFFFFLPHDFIQSWFLKFLTF